MHLHHVGKKKKYTSWMFVATIFKVFPPLLFSQIEHNTSNKTSTVNAFTVNIIVYVYSEFY